MAPELRTKEQNRLGQNAIKPMFFALLCILLCVLVGFSFRQTIRARDSAEPNQTGVKKPTLASTAEVASTRNTPDPFGCCWPADFGSDRLVSNRVGFPSNQQSTSQNGRADQRDARQPVANARSENEEIIVVPKMNVSSQRLSADGDPALITISLEGVRGSEKWVYKATEEIGFHLEPRNSSFTSSTVKILPGQSVSETTKLTAKRPETVEVSCTPERRHSDLTIKSCQPVKIEFVVPIDSVGIEPLSDQSPINIPAVFQVYLCNQKDPKTPLVPANEVSVDLSSQNGNGTVAEKTVKLTTSDSSRLVHYVGTRTGQDAILAVGTYEKTPIKGRSDRLIFFPWWTFFAGLAGALVGSLVRIIIGDRARKFQNFIESFAFGFVFCLIVIFFPTGTSLPQISDYVQPGLVLAFAILVGILGPEFLKQLISLGTPRSA